jgi:glycosyltransferase involved in cell wall biosynthesis
LNPLARVAWNRAAVILVQNEETLRWLPRSARSKAEVFHNVALDTPPVQRTRVRNPGDPPVAMFAGRLVPHKGVALAIRVIAHLPGWRLLVAGDGTDGPRLRALAGDLGVSNRVDFYGWVDREAVLAMMRDEADVFIIPSLHEEGGWAVGEALAAGLPVVCLNRGGPPVVGGHGVSVGDEATTVARLVRASRMAITEPWPLPPAPTVEERRKRLEALLARRGLGATLGPIDQIIARQSEPTSGPRKSGPTAVL